jgi:hypothetical protein
MRTVMEISDAEDVMSKESVRLLKRLNSGDKTVERALTIAMATSGCLAWVLECRINQYDDRSKAFEKLLTTIRETVNG